MSSELNRREAISTMAVLGAAGIGLSSARSSGSTLISSSDLGYDSKTNKYTLPELPYDYDALEPAIDAQTMTIHHSKHHAGYVNGLNNALSKLRSIRDGDGDPSIIQHWQRQLSFHAGGHINHTLFWSGMTPNPESDRPNGALGVAIDRDFGSFEQFSTQFQAAAKSVEGSGWGWLIYEPIAGRLLITQMQNQQQMLFAGAVPLLGVDVWEHAYYLKYQNRRADYIKAFMGIIDWSEIQRRFDAATA
jgi:Fe-Mn family superoxide dismutase